MRETGIYIDPQILSILAEKINNRRDYYQNPTQGYNDWRTINNMGAMPSGYYNLEKVPTGRLFETVDLSSIIKRLNQVR